MAVPAGRGGGSGLLAAAVVLLGCGTATGSPAVAAGPPAVRVAAATDLPDLGSALVPLDDSGEAGVAIATVHGVRRVEGATVLYYSFAVPPSASSPPTAR